jgi:4'-phosphopantetheinyl transferase EntD
MDNKKSNFNKSNIVHYEVGSVKSYFTYEKKELLSDKLGLPQNHNYSPQRLTDFSTGRYCATKSLEQMGIKDAIIPIGKDREPIWPEGIVGSISHCDSLTGAIVAKSSDHISLGLDIEEIGRVTPDLWDLVFTENEKNYLSGLSEKEKLLQSTAIFSAKEAFYKFQYPITRTFLDFLDVEVALPDINRIKVLSGAIKTNSPIRENTVSYYFENGCVVAMIASLNYDRT